MEKLGVLEVRVVIQVIQRSVWKDKVVSTGRVITSGGVGESVQG